MNRQSEPTGPMLYLQPKDRKPKIIRFDNIEAMDDYIGRLMQPNDYTDWTVFDGWDVPDVINFINHTAERRRNGN